MIVTKIREMAEARGIANAYQLQKATGLSPSMAARLWRDEVEMIGLSTLETLCNTFQCTPCELIVQMADKKSSKK